MTLRFDSYRYLWPPRPERTIAPTFLGELESLGWLAQAKMNGTNCMLYVHAGASVAMGRHGPSNKLNWQPGKRWDAFVKSLPAAGWYVFQGELLHSKVKDGPRDTVYLFDMLVEDGNYLVGVPYVQRHACLQRLLHLHNPAPICTHDHTEYGPGLWFATNHAHSFKLWYDAPAPSHVEGLVFKDPKARLLPCGRASSNTFGQAKCRYTKANVSF